jgi:hypothetical protein
MNPYKPGNMIMHKGRERMPRFILTLYNFSDKYVLCPGDYGDSAVLKRHHIPYTNIFREAEDMSVSKTSLFLFRLRRTLARTYLMGVTLLLKLYTTAKTRCLP